MYSRLTMATAAAGLALIVALVFAQPAAAQTSFGLMGGWAGSITQQGLGGFAQTKFQKGPTFGGGFGHRFGNNVSLELSASQLSMQLIEGGADLGTLRMSPIMLLLRGQGKPASGKGLTGHAQLGGGINLIRGFEKGRSVTDLERRFGARMEISNRNSAIFEVGGGVDYFFNRHVSLTTDFRLLLGNVKTSWVAVGRTSVPVEGFEKFLVSNGQALMGIRFWLN